MSRSLRTLIASYKGFLASDLRVVCRISNILQSDFDRKDLTIFGVLFKKDVCIYGLLFYRYFLFTDPDADKALFFIFVH